MYYKKNTHLNGNVSKDWPPKRITVGLAIIQNYFCPIMLGFVCRRCLMCHLCIFNYLLIIIDSGVNFIKKYYEKSVMKRD